jgi:asparaginyl-tRNA synthetase
MVEPEMAYATLDDVMTLSEELIAFVVARVLEKAQAGAEDPRARHGEAREGAGAVPADFLRRSRRDPHKKGIAFEWGGDFGAPDETALSEEFDRPVCVHRYPSKVKAFYMKPDPDRPEVALGVDVLAPEGYGEIIGGGERLADLDLLIARIKEHNLPQEAFEWYLDLRRYGSVPHGGFGMGIARVVTGLRAGASSGSIPYPGCSIGCTPKRTKQENRDQEFF